MCKGEDKREIEGQVRSELRLMLLISLSGRKRELS